MLITLLIVVLALIAIALVACGILSALSFVAEDFHTRECSQLATGDAGPDADDTDLEFWI